jgi:phosphocarrier protein
MTKEYTIVDEAGLHARPASLLSQAASKFPNPIYIEYKSRKLTLKSILMVMSLGVPKGALIKIHVDGENVEAVYEKLEAVLNEHKLIA